MSFNEAAQNALSGAKPVPQRVIVSDTEGTLFSGTTELNHVLIKFLGLAKEAGHHVFVVTRRGGFDKALESIEILFKFAQRRLKVDLSSIDVAFKDELQGILQERGLEKPFLAFEDDMKQLQGEKAYASPVFAEEVRDGNMESNIEDLKTYAGNLGFAAEFEAYLRERAAAPGFVPRMP